MSANFSACSLVRFLHHIPRYDVSHKKSSQTFTPQSHEYILSLGLLGTPFYMFAALTTLYFLLRCFLRRCRQCMCPQIKRFERISTIRLVTALFVMFVCVAGAIAWCLVINTQISVLTKDVNDMLSEWRSKQFVHTTSATTIVAELASVHASAYAALNTGDVQSIIDAGLTQGTEADDVFTAVLTNSSLFSVNMDNVTVDVQDFDVELYREYIKMFFLPRAIGQLAVLCLLCLPLVLLIVALITHSTSLLWLVTWLTVCMSVIAWVLVGMGAAVTVGVADFCDNPRDYFTSMLSENNTVGRAYALNYVDCNTTSPNPYLPLLNNLLEFSSTATLDIQLTLQDLQNITASEAEALNVTAQISRVEQSLLNINSSLAGIATDSGSLKTTLTCDAIHSHYVSSLNALCNRGVWSAASSIGCEILLAVLTIGLFPLASRFLTLFEPLMKRIGTRVRMIRSHVIRDDPNVDPEGSSRVENHQSSRTNSKRQTEVPLRLEELSLESLQRKHSKTVHNNKSHSNHYFSLGGRSSND